MVTFPIRIDRSGYKGSNPKKREKALERNRLASALESKINEILANQTAPIRTYSYHEIARVTGFDYETVKDLGYSIDCGSNGFTVCRKGLTLEQALEQAGDGSGA